MRVVFGIDVSKASSEVAILINREKVHGYTIPNDAIGFNRLLGDLKTVHQPEIVFEATGVYSRRLQAFFEDNSYAYTRLNPLESKKQLDSLWVRKTDKIDAEKLAMSQFILNRKPSYVQEALYQELRDLSRFYQNLTEDIVCAKNCLHKVLQVTFPELENILSAPTREQYIPRVDTFRGITHEKVLVELQSWDLFQDRYTFFFSITWIYGRFVDNDISCFEVFT